MTFIIQAICPNAINLQKCVFITKLKLMAFLYSEPDVYQSFLRKNRFFLPFCKKKKKILFLLLLYIQ